jgi:hypothetical protein
LGSSIELADFRVQYFREAQTCLELVEKQKVDQPEFWANLLGAIANASLAAVSDVVVRGVLADCERDRKLRQEVYDHIQERLSGD